MNTQLYSDLDQLWEDVWQSPFPPNLHIDISSLLRIPESGNFSQLPRLHRMFIKLSASVRLDKETINCSSIKPESWSHWPSWRWFIGELTAFEVEGIDIVVSISPWIGELISALKWEVLKSWSCLDDEVWAGICLGQEINPASGELLDQFGEMILLILIQIYKSGVPNWLYFQNTSFTTSPGFMASS